MRWLLIVILVLGVALFGAACQGDEEEGDATATEAPSPGATAESPKTPDLAPGWTKIEPDGDAICSLGTPYAFYVHPGTVNRLAVIGWNAINIGILVALIYKQFKDGSERWVQSVQSVFSWGTNAYLAWTLFLILAIPLLFKG